MSVLIKIARVGSKVNGALVASQQRGGEVILPSIL